MPRPVVSAADVPVGARHGDAREQPEVEPLTYSVGEVGGPSADATAAVTPLRAAAARATAATVPGRELNGTCMSILLLESVLVERRA